MESDWPKRNKSHYVTEIVSWLRFADVIFRRRQATARNTSAFAGYQASCSSGWLSLHAVMLVTSKHVLYIKKCRNPLKTCSYIFHNNFCFHNLSQFCSLGFHIHTMSDRSYSHRLSVVSLTSSKLLVVISNLLLNKIKIIRKISCIRKYNGSFAFLIGLNNAFLLLVFLMIWPSNESV